MHTAKPQATRATPAEVFEHIHQQRTMAYAPAPKLTLRRNEGRITAALAAVLLVVLVVALSI